VILAVVPTIYNCSADGKSLTLENGRSVAMKCLWTARASLATAVPLAVAGLLLALARRRETQRALAVMAAALGGFAILLPTWLIGVCSAMGSGCNEVTKPVLILGGSLAIVGGVVAFALSRDRPGPPVAVA
jgi:Domain of unknown function (DUF4418)